MSNSTAYQFLGGLLRQVLTHRLHGEPEGDCWKTVVERYVFKEWSISTNVNIEKSEHEFEYELSMMMYVTASAIMCQKSGDGKGLVSS